MVIACGGDGTVNEIINGLAGSQVPLALLPAGTANILAKELGIPWDIPHAARLIADGVVRRIAIGVAIPTNGNHSASLPNEGRYFLSVGGAGPDGAIVNAVDEGWKKRAGVIAYWAQGFKQLVNYGFPEMNVHCDGQTRARLHRRGRQNRKLWRAIQNNHRRKFVRRFFRDGHEFHLQPFSLSHLLAGAMARKTP